MIDFTEQVAVVTGAGRGLGRLYALDLARRGAAVVVNDLGGTMAGDGTDASVADTVVAEIEATGGRAVGSYESVDTPEGGQAIVDLAVSAFGRLDAVVSNAGIFQTRPFEELTPDDWQRMRRVHLDGAFYLAQPAYRVMKAQGYGRFVMIASSAGLFGQHLAAHYSAAKAGVFGLTNVIAAEGAPHGILANAVLPFGQSRMVWETAQERPSDGESFITAIRPELVVPMVVYLASGACTFSHHNYSAGAGRFARVFAGLAEGWLAPRGSPPSAEDIETHIAEVSATEPFTVPMSIVDEVFGICARLGISV
ncbi:MAG TPA: SDR family NAD(P)-dependent oxidoreductase [Acidimicrobiia bacterium]|nr:SDR family NAD(P)-dependent oxidoreductase [Acidimicrobiia bacterium]